MVYSARPMEDRAKAPETTEIKRLEEKVGELERLAGALGDVPDENLVATLNEAVELLGDINARIEANVAAAGDEAGAADALLAGADFGPFDEALEDLERRERNPGAGG